MTWHSGFFVYYHQGVSQIWSIRVCVYIVWCQRRLGLGYSVLARVPRLSLRATLFLVGERSTHGPPRVDKVLRRETLKGRLRISILRALKISTFEALPIISGNLCQKVYYRFRCCRSFKLIGKARTTSQWKARRPVILYLEIRPPRTLLWANSEETQPVESCLISNINIPQATISLTSHLRC